MKIPMPEPELDEFGDEIIRPIESGRSPDGQTIYVKNLNEWTAYEKQLSRNRDARMLERGEIDQAGLIRKTACFMTWISVKFRSWLSATGDTRTSTDVYSRT